MVIGSYVSIITLNENGLKAPTKRLNGYKTKIPVYAVYNRPNSYFGTCKDWKWGTGKRYFMKMEIQRAQSSNAYIK